MENIGTYKKNKKAAVNTAEKQHIKMTHDS